MKQMNTGCVLNSHFKHKCYLLNSMLRIINES